MIIGSNFFLSLEHPGLLSLAVYFDTLMENLITVLFHLWTNAIKAAHDEQKSLEIKVILAPDIKGFVLLSDIVLFLKESLIYFSGR